MSNIEQDAGEIEVGTGEPEDEIFVLATGAQFEMVDEGTYQMVLAKIEVFRGRDFTTGEPKDALQLTFVIDSPGQKWDGYHVDRIANWVANLSNEASTLHEIFVALTGGKPEAGRRYGLRQALVGKACIGKVEHHRSRSQKTGQEQVYPRVTQVMPLVGARPAPRAASAPTASQSAAAKRNRSMDDFRRRLMGPAPGEKLEEWPRA